jgi:hypothetical protein
VIRNHDQHRTANDLAVDLRRQAKLIDRVQQAERDRERRRILATLVITESTEDPDFPGCVW